jgi:hypothetical protein
LQLQIFGDLVPTLSKLQFERHVQRLISGQQELASFSSFLQTWQSVIELDAASESSQSPRENNTSKAARVESPGVLSTLAGGIQHRLDELVLKEDSSDAASQSQIPGTPNPEEPAAECRQEDLEADRSRIHHFGDTQEVEAQGSASQRVWLCVQIELQLVEAGLVEGWEDGSVRAPASGAGVNTDRHLVLASFCQVPELSELTAKVQKLEGKFQQTIDLIPELVFSKDLNVSTCGCSHRLLLPLSALIWSDRNAKKWCTGLIELGNLCKVPSIALANRGPACLAIYLDVLAMF